MTPGRGRATWLMQHQRHLACGRLPLRCVLSFHCHDMGDVVKNSAGALQADKNHVLASAQASLPGLQAHASSSATRTAVDKLRMICIHACPNPCAVPHTAALLHVACSMFLSEVPQ